MTATPEPTGEERAAAEDYHASWCGYSFESECPLSDRDPGERFLLGDLEHIRGQS